MKRFHLKSTHKKPFFSFAVRFFLFVYSFSLRKVLDGESIEIATRKKSQKEQINKQNEEKMNKQRRITNEKYFSLPNIFLYQW